MGTLGRIYIAGPMAGMPEHNYPTFRAAAERFREAGWDVVNPAENFGGRTDLPRSSYLRADVALLAQCDAIALLPGWQSSRGAKIEYCLARELGLMVINAATLTPMPDAPEPTLLLDAAPESQRGGSILDDARYLTSCERQVDYGHPRDDFTRVAAMWNGILAAKLRDGAAITAMDVPLCLIAVKLARQTHRHRRDNLVDIAGYARTAAMVAEEE